MKPWAWRDPVQLLALAWGVVTLATRLPFRARRMWDHDSIQFALGVENFDLAAHHPHPPGYPIYVALLKLLAALGVEPLEGMVALSLGVGSLGATWIVLLVARLVREGERASRRTEVSVVGDPWRSRAPRAAFFAGALYAFNPHLWFYGELPLLYVVEGALATGVAYSALRSAEGLRPFVLASVLYPLAGGIRPSSLVLLVPLYGYGAWRGWRNRSLGLRDLALGGGLTAGLTLAWAIPLLVAAGGLGPYLEINRQHFGALLPYTSILYGAGWSALIHHLELLVKWGLQGLFPGACALGVLWLMKPRSLLPGVRLLLRQGSWLLAWLLPPLTFFALFHVTKAGYTLIYLPALLAGVALLAAPALTGRSWTAGVAVVALVGGGLFLLGEDRDPGQARLWAIVRHEFNRGTVTTYEEELERVGIVVRQYPPSKTVLVTVELSGTGEWGPQGFLYPWHRHLQWYFPEYPVVLLVPEEEFALVTQGHQPFRRVEREVPLPRGFETLLFILSGSTGERFPLPPGQVLYQGGGFRIQEVPLEPGTFIPPFRLVPGWDGEEGSGPVVQRSACFLH